MASLSIPFPDFIPGTTIVSSEVDSNNAAIVDYINARNSGGATWDVVATVGQLISTLTTNQILLGTTRTVTLNAPTPATLSRVYTFPDLGGDYSLLGNTGAQTITGAKTFANQTLLLQETGGTDVVTINVAALTAGRAYTVPEVGAAADFVMTEGAQTINGAKTFSGVSAINSTFIGMGRNRIINGDMRIDQRNAGAAVTVNSTADFFTIDRFKADGTAADGVFTLQRVTSSVPTGFDYSLKVTATTADASVGAAQSYRLLQAIEGNNVRDLLWGTADAKTITLSFWARSSITGTFAGSLRNSASDRSYIFNYTISVADTWEKKTITISGDTSGTWLKNESVGVWVTFDLGSGSNSEGTVNAWQAGSLWRSAGAVRLISTLNATLYISGLQFEIGNQATSFEYRMQTFELQLCQRYYEKSWDTGTVPGTATNRGQTFGTRDTGGYSLCAQWKVTKRDIPTVVIYSPASGASGKARNYNVGADENASANSPGTFGTDIGATTATINDLLGFHFTATSEL